MTSLYGQETANRRNSVLLVVIVMFAFALFGYVIGYVLTGDSGAQWPPSRSPSGSAC